MKWLESQLTEPIEPTNEYNKSSTRTDSFWRSPYGAVTVGMQLLLTFNEIVNELAGWGAEVKRLSHSRGGSPYWRRFDKSHCSSLHIQADNWAPGRSRSRRVPTVMRKSAALGSLCFYGDGRRNWSSWVCDLCNGKHLRLIWDWLSRDERHGEESKYRIIWFHMSVWVYGTKVKMSLSFLPTVR